MFTRPVLLGLLISAVVAPPGVGQEPLPTPAKGRTVGGAIALTFRPTGAPLREAAISPDGSTLATLTEDDRLVLRRTADHLAAAPGAKVEGDRRFRYGLRNLALGPDGSLTLAKIGPSALAVLDARPRIQHQLRGMPGVHAAVFHPDGVHVLAGTTIGILRLWNAKTGKSVSYLPREATPYTFLGITPDGKAIVTVDEKKMLRFLGFPQAPVLRETTLATAPRTVAFRADGTLLAYPNGRSVHVLNATTLEQRAKHELPHAVERLAYDKAGRTLAAGLANGHVALVDTASGKVRHTWPAHHERPLGCLRFVQTAGRELLVTAAPGDDVVFWDCRQFGGSAQGRKGKAGRRPGRKKRR